MSCPKNEHARKHQDSAEWYTEQSGWNWALEGNIYMWYSLENDLLLVAFILSEALIGNGMVNFEMSQKCPKSVSNVQ